MWVASWLENGPRQQGFASKREAAERVAGHAFAVVYEIDDEMPTWASKEDVA